MPDRENVVTHLQIIHTWAGFALERDLQFFTKKHLEDIEQWTADALALLKEQGKQKFFVDKSGKITPLPVKEKETVKPKTDSIRRFRCGVCEEIIGRGQHYCGNCGREVDWNA